RTCALTLAGSLALASCFVDEPGQATTRGGTGDASTSGTDTDAGSTGATASTGATGSTGATDPSSGGAAVCGDGKIEGAEECDSGELNGTMSLCTSDCTINVC